MSETFTEPAAIWCGGLGSPVSISSSKSTSTATRPRGGDRRLLAADDAAGADRDWNGRPSK